MVRCSSRSVSSLDGLVVGHPLGAAGLVDDHAPNPLQEAVCADDVLGGPRPRRLQRAHRHLVDAQGVGAVLLADLVGRHRVLQALADLAELLGHLDLAVGRRIAELPVALDDFGGGHVGAARVGVGERLDVALVDQPPVRLAGADVAEVVEHLVPEPRVQQVQHRVLDTADVQVDAAGIAGAVLGRARPHPVRLVLLGAERLRVVRVGVAQLVPGAARPLRHDVGVAGVGLAGRHRGRVRRSPIRWPCPAAATVRCRRRRDRTAPARSPGCPAVQRAVPIPAADGRGRRRRRRSGTARPSTADGRTASPAACTRRGRGRGRRPPAARRWPPCADATLSPSR